LYEQVNTVEWRARDSVATEKILSGTVPSFLRKLTPLAAQPIADSLDCFLPTRKLVDEIYKAATVKIAPVPMYIYRDNFIKTNRSL
jgi:hypothetical protein